VIVLGIDPGSRKAGWGVIEVGRRGAVPLDWGIIRLTTSSPIMERLVELHDALMAVITQHRPAQAAVEGMFQGGRMQNVQSVLKLGHARGVVLLAIGQAGLPLAEYAPAEVKKAITGRGRAEKWQMQEMVKSLLSLPELPGEDAADALAIALCHGFRLQSPLPGGLR
jgi:crossover junction endodeoxyribonuclease RuvC